MDLEVYDGKIVRVADSAGRVFTGVADTSSPEYCFHEYGREEACINVNGYLLFARDIAAIEVLPRLEILRAAETWQLAGAFYVRIQAASEDRPAELRREFDPHDGPEARYILVTDDGFPVATARMYPLDSHSMMIGRAVVLPGYRHQGIGTMVIDACEAWAEDLHYSKTVVESREDRAGFFRELGYEACGEAADAENVRRIRMEKVL